MTSPSTMIQFSSNEIQASSSSQGPTESKESTSTRRAFGSGFTEFFPETNASMRGSDVMNDMAALSGLSTQDDFGAEATYFDDGFQESGEIGYDDCPDGVEIEGEHCHHNPDVNTVQDLESHVMVEEWLEEQETGNQQYFSARKHFLRIINTLNYDEKIMDVGNYQTVNDILKFYSEYNPNCKEYVWKDIWGNTLKMNKSLGENGLMDNGVIIDEIGLDHFPTILLYFKDGFENEPPMRLDISVPLPTDLGAPCRNY